jgi:hypothetical protein
MGKPPAGMRAGRGSACQDESKESEGQDGYDDLRAT